MPAQRHPLEHLQPVSTSGGDEVCPRDAGYTPLVRESAGMAFRNPGAQIVTRLMCNRCGGVIEAPAVDHPSRGLGLREQL